MSVRQIAALGDRLVHQTARLTLMDDRLLERRVIPYLKECAAMTVVPAEAANLAERMVRKTSAASRLRPALLLAVAGVLDRTGEVTTVIQCLSGPRSGLGPGERRPHAPDAIPEEVRRRTKVVGRFQAGTSYRRLLFTILVAASQRWRGVRIPKPALVRQGCRTRNCTKALPSAA